MAGDRSSSSPPSPTISVDFRALPPNLLAARAEVFAAEAPRHRPKSFKNAFASPVLAPVSRDSAASRVSTPRWCLFSRCLSFIAAIRLRDRPSQLLPRPKHEQVTRHLPDGSSIAHRESVLRVACRYLLSGAAGVHADTRTDARLLHEVVTASATSTRRVTPAITTPASSLHQATRSACLLVAQCFPRRWCMHDAGADVPLLRLLMAISALDLLDDADDFQRGERRFGNKCGIST